MVNENIIPKENYKQVAEVREGDYQVPSYEEFMKSYEVNSNHKFNYDDLNYSDISDKGKGYDGKWEDYKKAVDNFFSEMEESRDNPVRQVMDHPVTSFVTEFLPPNPFTIKYNLSVQAEEGVIEARGKERQKSCYKTVCDKYNEIKDWYYRIKNR